MSAGDQQSNWTWTGNIPPPWINPTPYPYKGVYPQHPSYHASVIQDDIVGTSGRKDVGTSGRKDIAEKALCTQLQEVLRVLENLLLLLDGKQSSRDREALLQRTRQRAQEQVLVLRKLIEP